MPIPISRLLRQAGLGRGQILLESPRIRPGPTRGVSPENGVQLVNDNVAGKHKRYAGFDRITAGQQVTHPLISDQINRKPVSPVRAVLDEIDLAVDRLNAKLAT